MQIAFKSKSNLLGLNSHDLPIHSMSGFPHLPNCPSYGHCSSPIPLIPTRPRKGKSEALSCELTVPNPCTWMLSPRHCSLPFALSWCTPGHCRPQRSPAQSAVGSRRVQQNNLLKGELWLRVSGSVHALGCACLNIAGRLWRAVLQSSSGDVCKPEMYLSLFQYRYSPLKPQICCTTVCQILLLFLIKQKIILEFEIQPGFFLSASLARVDENWMLFFVRKQAMISVNKANLEKSRNCSWLKCDLSAEGIRTFLVICWCFFSFFDRN